jgi:hypothetical protein
MGMQKGLHKGNEGQKIRTWVSKKAFIRGMKARKIRIWVGKRAFIRGMKAKKYVYGYATRPS